MQGEYARGTSGSRSVWSHDVQIGAAAGRKSRGLRSQTARVANLSAVLRRLKETSRDKGCKLDLNHHQQVSSSAGLRSRSASCNAASLLPDSCKLRLCLLSNLERTNHQPQVLSAYLNLPLEIKPKR